MEEGTAGSLNQDSSIPTQSPENQLILGSQSHATTCQKSFRFGCMPSIWAICHRGRFLGAFCLGTSFFNCPPGRQEERGLRLPLDRDMAAPGSTLQVTPALLPAPQHQKLIAGTQTCASSLDFGTFSHGAQPGPQTVTPPPCRKWGK